MSKLKVFIIAFLLLWILVPSAVFAASTLPQFNPLCWQEGKAGVDNSQDPLSCLGARQKWLGENDQTAADGWIKDAECGGTGDDIIWGKCLAPGRTVASVALGGKRIFNNIGEYIKTGYKVAISVATILAAVIIIISGLQWTASGGNSEVISSAKKRIGGAVIGLTLALSSYLFLNTINPALINLRLPQAYMIRQVSALAYWCKEFTDPNRFSGSDSWIKRFAYAGRSSDIIDRAIYNNLKDQESGGSFVFSYGITGGGVDGGEPLCGSQYFPQGGGGSTCYGDSCKFDSTCQGSDCMCFPPLANNQIEYGCQRAKMGGIIYSSSGEGGCLNRWFSGSGWEWSGNSIGWASSVKLVAVNKYSGPLDVGGLESPIGGGFVNASKMTQSFIINYNDDSVISAQTASGFLGFSLKIVLNPSCFNPILVARYVGKGGREITDFSTVSSGSLFSPKDLLDSVPPFFTIDISNINAEVVVKGTGETEKLQEIWVMTG